LKKANGLGYKVRSYSPHNTVFLFGGELVPSLLKFQLHRVVDAFVTNTEAVNGVTYWSKGTRTLTLIDLINAEVGSLYA
jgi:hypothetical protein